MVQPLTWSEYPYASTPDLELELLALADHLEAWARSPRPVVASDPATPQPEPATELATLLREAKVASVEQLPQSFMPAVDILRLRLKADGNESEGIFLRQRIARGLPTLWPLLDSASNLYAFLRAIPGVLDMTRESVLNYGMFFAGEAIVSTEGPFTVFPDFPSLPPECRDALRENLSNLRPEAETDSLLSSTLAHIDAALGGQQLTDFNRPDYNRNRDAYLFAVFVAYGTGLFSATISVDRASGVPMMTDDAPLAPIPARARLARLGPHDLPDAFRIVTPLGDGVGVPVGPELTTITAANATRAIAEESVLQDKLVEGVITLSGTALPGPMAIRNCEVRGDLRCSGLRVAGDLTFEDVQVEGTIDLRGIQVAGSIRLSRIRLTPGAVSSEFTTPGGEGVQLRDATIGGVLEIHDCELGGPLSLADTQVNTIVRLSSVRATEVHARRLSVVRGPIVIGGAATPSVAEVPLEPASFGLITQANLDLSGASTPSWLSLAGSHIGGSCRLGNLRVRGDLEIGRQQDGVLFIREDLDISGSQVEGNVTLRSAHVGGSVVAQGGRIAGMLRLGAVHGRAAYREQDCRVGKDLSLTSIEVRGPFSLGGVQLQGCLRLELCGLGALIVEPRLAWDASADRVATLVPSKVRNGIEIRACEIRGELRLSGAFVNERYAGRYAIEITNSTVGQGVSFWDEGLAEPRSTRSIPACMDEAAEYYGRERGQWKFEPFDVQATHGGWPLGFAELPTDASAAAASPPAAARTEISLAELLANLSARHIHTEIRGDLRMALCKVGGDLCLTSLRAKGCAIVLEGLDIQGDLLAEWKGQRYTVPAGDPSRGYVGLLNCRAATVVVTGSTIKGEARLSGLRLTGHRSAAERPSASAASGEDRSAALAIRYTKVEGVLALSDVVPDPASASEASSRAGLHGDLDVSWSTIDHLILDGKSLGATPRGRGVARGRSPHRLVAVSSTVRKLELRDPLPGEVDLADARVTVWDFGPVEGDELLERFRNVLGNQKPFRRNVYQETEAYLHNAGFEDLAKAVRIDLVKRQHREARTRLRNRGAPRWARFWAGVKRLVSWANRHLTGNFTSEGRPIFWWLVLWLVASLYFRDPATVDVGSVYQGSFRADPGPICGILRNWGLQESVKFSTRYVVPVVPAVGMEELGAGDRVRRPPLCAAGGPPRSARLTLLSDIRARVDWFRPSTFATGVRVLSWLLLSLATGTIFAKMSRTPRRSA